MADLILNTFNLPIQYDPNELIDLNKLKSELSVQNGCICHHPGYKVTDWKWQADKNTMYVTCIVMAPLI